MIDSVSVAISSGSVQMRRILTAIGAAILAAVAGSASAGPYLGIDAGWAWAADVDFNLPTAPNAIHPTSFETGYVVAVRGGWRFDDRGPGTPRLELELSWRSNDVDRFGGQGDVGPGTGSLDATAYMLNALYEFMPGSRFRPYVGLGLGVVDAEAKTIRKDLSGTQCCTGIINGSDSGFAWQAIVGAAFEATRNWAITLDYRYLASGSDLTYGYKAGCLPDGSFCARPPGETDAKYTSQTLSIGVRYAF